MWQHTRMTCD